MYKRDKLLGQFIQDYYFERFRQMFFLRDYGFICYRIEHNTVIIDEFYIKREFRKGRKCFDFADEFLAFANRLGCTQLIGFVNKEVSNGYMVEKLFRMYGMKEDVEHSQHQPNYIKYEKDIG